MTYPLLGAVLALAIVAPSLPPTISSPAGTWILQLEGDASSLAVKGASLKPFAYRAPRQATFSDYRVALLDSKGKVLTTVPLDLSSFCMNPSHRGDGPHLRGDVVYEHAVVMTVKVPARPDAAEVRIEDVSDAKKPVSMGSIDRKSLVELTGANRKRVR